MSKCTNCQKKLKTKIIDRVVWVVIYRPTCAGPTLYQPSSVCSKGCWDSQVEVLKKKYNK